MDVQQCKYVVGRIGNREVSVSDFSWKRPVNSYFKTDGIIQKWSLKIVTIEIYVTMIVKCSFSHSIDIFKNSLSKRVKMAY